MEAMNSRYRVGIVRSARSCEAVFRSCWSPSSGWPSRFVLRRHLLWGSHHFGQGSPFAVDKWASGEAGAGLLLGTL